MIWLGPDELAAVGFSGMGKVGPRSIGPSRFWMTAGQVPEPNEDTRRLYEAYTYLPHTFALRKWSEEEEAELRKIVLHSVQVCLTLAHTPVPTVWHFTCRLTEEKRFQTK